MRLFKSRLLWSTAFVLMALVMTIHWSGEAATPSKGLDVSNMDTSVPACQDFYRYASGGWMKKNPIPAAYPSWGSANIVDEKNRETLRGILEADAKNTSAAKGSSAQKLGNFYASCMDEQKIEAEGTKPLMPELELINKMSDAKDLQAEIARLHGYGVNALFRFGSDQDFKDSTKVIGSAGQGGLGLPDRDYYLKDDEKSKTLRDQYVKHVAKMFELMGDDAQAAQAAAQTVLGIETTLARASMTRVERRKPENVYHKMTLAQLKELTPNFSWEDYFKRIGATQITEVNVGQPDFFKEADKQLTAVPLADWKTYLRWHLINSAASALSAKFVDEDFNFKGRTLTGTQENLPRWKRCVSSTDRAMGEALGEEYVKVAFTPQSKARMAELVGNLIAALREDIGTLSWMSEATRKQAVTKLAAFVRKIGYPDKWRDYSALEVDRGSFLTNRFRAINFEARRDLNKIGKPVDRTEWGMSPPTVNAYYNPSMNEIVFPAGILQPPFFNAEADDAINYGAIGAVIGHEMTHGFDDQGAKFDAEGNLKNWWADTDLKNFQGRAQCVINQFSSFVVDEKDNLHEKGELVAGESIADLGGLTIAYAAFQKSLEGKPRPPAIDGFTPEQRFFLGYAQVWATNSRPEFERLLVNIDPHPLPRFRVNGPLSNMPTFQQAFQCKKGDAMVREDRCQIW
ncbi:MAG TPA: M13 family metallopeptidase [Pyrinomonadaceae bacterium]|jgi:putative endopeptidase